MKKWFGKHLGRQLSTPKGFWGAVLGKLMNYGNKPMYEAAYTSLGLRANDKVLEIGFGNGAFISDIIQKVQPGTYAGVDISATMIRLAQRRNASLIKSEKVQLVLGDVSTLPFSDSSFTKVFTVNTIYFWENPLQVMQEIKRVLVPGGKFVIALATREAMKDKEYVKERFKLYEKDDVEALFIASDFTHVRSTFGELKFENVLCMSGHKTINVS